MEQKIKSFTDLIAWREAHKLVVLVYKVTEQFPKNEMFSLTDQMRRCGVSISSNIAEGFSRHGKKEKVQFYYMAKGSLTELQNQILIANQTIITNKLLIGLIRFLKSP